MPSDTKLVRLTREQAALVVYLTSAGVMLTGGTWNDETSQIEVPMTEDFQQLYTAVLKVVPWMRDIDLTPGDKRVRLLDEFTRTVVPLISWMDPPSDSPSPAGEQS